MRLFGFTKRGTSLQAAAVSVGGLAALTALGMFAYLGTFTRYLADDYCEAVRVTFDPVLASLLQRYMTSSDRYSNLLFVALSEKLVPRNVQYLPIVMIALWTAALVWLVYEIKKTAGLQWPLAVDILLGTLLAFFPIFEAPNRFQTIYWRSGMATHFAPLVYLTAFGALLLRLIRRGHGARPAIWAGPLCLLLAFFGGGFSEPPDAMLVSAALLGLAAVWLWDHGDTRRPALGLLAWTLGGGLLALLVMGLSPANSFRLGTPPPAPPLLIYRTALYSIQFTVDSLRTMPLPTMVSVILAGLVFYTLFACAPGLSSGQNRRLGLLAAATPVLMYFMIAASFAPSVYGQAYPVERARFAGRWMMTSAAIVEGGLLGTLAAQWRPIRSRAGLVNAASILLALGSLYVPRAAASVLQTEVPYAAKWSAAWDQRQTLLYADKAAGQMDISIPQLPGFEHVKELDPRANLWLNRCAATFYGVQSISAPQHQYLQP